MEIEERGLGDLTVRIDRLICVGFETCLEASAELFVMDEEGIATFAGGAEQVDPSQIVEACRACPVDALQVCDALGTQVVP